MDILFMITHDANFNTAIQALILIYQVATAKQVLFQALYKADNRLYWIGIIEHYTNLS